MLNAHAVILQIKRKQNTKGNNNVLSSELGEENRNEEMILRKNMKKKVVVLPCFDKGKVERTMKLRPTMGYKTIQVKRRKIRRYHESGTP